MGADSVLPGGRRKITQNRPYKNKFGGGKLKVINSLNVFKTGREKFASLSHWDKRRGDERREKEEEKRMGGGGKEEEEWKGRG
jgi:hypothetical protein